MDPSLLNSYLFLTAECPLVTTKFAYPELGERPRAGSPPVSGEVLVRQGELGSYVLALNHGVVKVSRVEADGRELLLVSHVRFRRIVTDFNLNDE